MLNIEPEKKKIKIMLPDDWSNDRRGNFLEDLVSKLLRKARFKVNQRVWFTGMEIDVLADNLDTQERAYVECKFLKEPFSAGIITDLLGKALVRRVSYAYLFSTVSPGKQAKGVLDELLQSPPQHGPKLAFVGPDELFDWFVDTTNVDYQAMIKRYQHLDNISSLTLLICQNDQFFWVVEELERGLPFRAIIFSASKNAVVELDRLQRDFEKNGICQGLNILNGDSTAHPINTNKEINEEVDEEILTSVNMADSFDDYRPCRPQDFVGRQMLQQDVHSFLQKILDGSTMTRNLCFSGPSGFGKSSVILKLEDRFKSKKWKNKFYLFPIDVRSAKGHLFVAKSVRSALQKAINDSFIDLPDHNIEINDTNLLLASSSMSLALNKLQEQERVILIFFDQFEELFSKESLFYTFEAFQRLAFEVDALKANLVIGFCWRTGINIPDDHPAYHIWHSLKDKRLDFRLSTFTSDESSLLLSQLEKYLDQKLERQLRRRLIEQCQGLPWLLKKLCIHIYQQIQEGANQFDLLARQLDVKVLFDEDLETLSKESQTCLKYIANNSPAEMVDVIDQFGHETIDRLYSSRLIIRAGQRYAVYWDIFRDYLVNQIVPAIPFTYIPQTEISMSLKALLNLQKEGGSLEFSKLANNLGYKQKTVLNIVADLQAFLMIQRKPNNLVVIQDDLTDSSIQQFADFLAEQLREHIVVRTVFQNYSLGNSFQLDNFKEILANSYPAVNFNPKTLNAYTLRILKWLVFSGLLETDNIGTITLPTDIGNRKGTTSLGSRLSVVIREGLFLCSSGPSQVVGLALELVKKNTLSQETILANGWRNAATDLVCLGLASRRYRGLVPSPILRQIGAEQKKDVLLLVQEKAFNSLFLKTLNNLLSQEKNLSDAQMINEILKVLKKSWASASAKRYISAGKTWLKYFEKHQFQQTSLKLFEEG